MEAIIDNCFSLNPVYVFKKRRFCTPGKASVFAKLKIGKKRQKNILVSLEKEKQKLTLIIIFYCSYCVYA